MPHDLKFMKLIRRLFERVAPGIHRYIVVGELAEGSEFPQWAECAIDSRSARELLAVEASLDGLVLHGVQFSAAAEIIRDIPESIGVAWYVWGYEAYEYWPRLSRDLLMPQTARLVKRSRGWRGLEAGVQLVREIRACDSRVRRLLDRIDFCVVQIPEEYELYRDVGLVHGTTLHWGSYGDLEDYVATSVPPTASPVDIQVGNSASPTNNHLDAFSLLSGLSEESRVVVPLSYGDADYRTAIIEAGLTRFGPRFSPLEGFLSLEEYQQALSSCGHVIMNHRRQQAVGNVIAALWRGARVYLNDTTVYKGFRNLGFDIALIQDSFGGPHPRLLPTLSDATVERHQQLLHEHLAPEKVLRETADLLNSLAAGRPARSC